MKTLNRVIFTYLLFLMATADVLAAAGVKTGVKVGGISITSTPINTTLGYAVGEIVQATVPFVTLGASSPYNPTTTAANVIVTGTPSLKLNIGGNIRIAKYTSGSGTSNLVFSYTIVAGDVDTNGIAVDANSLATDNGSINNGDTVPVATTLAHVAIANMATDKVQDTTALDTTDPVFRSAVASGSTITLTYDEIGSGLKATPTPATDRFAFSRTGGSALSITGVIINHTAQTVSLGLSGVINFSDTDLKVSYTANGTNDLQDVAGNKVANLSNVFVANVMPIFDAQGNHFTFNSPTVKVAANSSIPGSTAGDKILYSKVLSVDGQDIDAIVTTVEVSNLNTTNTASGINLDGIGPTSTSTAPSLNDPNNNPYPDSNWYKLNVTTTNGGGYVKLRFDFIKSGTFSDTTHTGENVTLQNIIVNSYDLDMCTGNCQYQEFGGFSSYALASNTTLTPVATIDKLTKFTTATSGNVTSGPGTSAGDQIRVMALYENIHSFEIKTGQPGNSAAYFYIDFSQGPNWNSVYKEYKNPTVNPRVTDDTTPYLTGTFVGTVAGYTDTVWKLEVMVNGVTYTASTRNDSGNTATITGNGLTGIFDKTTGVGNWNITIPTALPLGTYDVVAMSYFGANLAGATKVTTDDTTNELVINNVPADTINPTLIAFERLSPLNATITQAGIAVQNYVDFKATFSEAVTNVDRTDFQVTGTASTGLSISSAVQSSSTTYTVRVSNIPTSSLGTLNLDLAAREDIVDLAGNLLTNIIPTGNDETYTIVTSVPAGITVSSISGLTTEAGGSATFTVALNSQPTANVTIGLSSSDTTEGTVSPSSLTFTPYDWSSPKTVTVTGVDDLIVDGNIGYSIVTAAASSTDTNYNNLNAADVSVTNTDNDVVAPTVTLSVNNTSIAEAAGTSTVTATLSAAASNATTVTIAATGTATGGTDYTLSSTTITLAAGQLTGTATITAVQDNFDENDETVIVDITGVSGGDGATESGTQQRTVTIIDDDVAGITVSPVSGLITTEAGGTATFTVKLNSQPTADVIIGLTSSNTNEGTVAPSSLTFTSGNWNTAQTVTVTGVNDYVADGNVNYSIITAPASSSDTKYNNLNAADVSVTNKAPPIATNDVGTYTPGWPQMVNVLTNDTSDNSIVVTSVSIVGGTDSNSDGANEQIVVANEGTWTVNTTTGAITFTPLANPFAIPPNEFFGNPTPISYTVKDELGMTSNAATVTVTLNTCTANIGSFSGTVWSDVNYNKTLDAGETPLANVPVTLVPQGTTLGPTQIQVTGTDGAFNFATAPAGAYLLQVQDANLNAARHLYPTDSSLYFTSIATCEHKTKNYGYAPTQYPVLGDLIWYDGNANGIQDDWFDANDDGQVTKNDPNVLTNMADWEWIDLNGDDSFTGAANEGELNKCGFGQSASTGNVWVTDTATNVIKKVIVGIQGYWRTRPNYGAYNVVLNLTADGGALSNAAQAMAATGKCKTIVNPRSTSPIRNKVEEKMLSGATLICAPTGGAAGYNVTLADPGTGNPQPERLDIDFGITCRANQAPIALDMTNTTPLLLSAGPTTLDALTGTDSDGSIVAITILTLPTAAQGTLFMADGTTAVTVNQELTVAEAASLKFDPSGTFVGNSTFTFKVTDNNGAISTNTATATVAVVTPPGITVTRTTGLVTTERGGTDIFTVVLESQPIANVIIGLSSSNTNEGTVSPTSLTFTSGTWNTAQTVTVTGVDDSIVDGDIEYSIITAAAISTDANYDGLNTTDVSVTNNDNDAIGITVTPTTGLITTEAGGKATFTVKLNSQPTTNVMLALSSSDNTEGNVPPTDLNFTATTWNTPQTVTVTGVDDGIIDNDIPYTITTAAATSADTNYAGFDADDVNVTNTNDDILPAPGGVAGYLQLWLATDAGIRTDANNNVTTNKAVYDWISQSFNKYTAKNSAGNNQIAPLFLNNATDNLNFNPVIKFDGSKNGLDLSSNYLFSTNGTGMTLLAVAKPNATQTAAKTIIDFGNATKLGIGIGYGNAAMSFYTPTNGGGVDAGNVALTTSTNPVVVTGRATFANKQELFVNGESIYSKTIPNLAQLTASNISAAATHQTAAGPVTIGRRSNTSSNLFAGIIPEVIIYNTSLSTTELAQVQSYLAIKYGITLNTNYLASDGTTIRTINDGYDYDIAGIGRDDDSDLYQLKSKSSNSGALVTMEIGSITADKSFLTWGDNGGVVTYSGIGAPTDMDTSLKILGRTWKVTNSGNIGPITLSTVAAIYAKFLLVDDDGNFTTGATASEMTNNAVDVTLANGKYFTLATPEPPAPIAITDNYSAATINSVSVFGKVNANGMTTAVKFEYGLTASYGNTQVAAPATVTGNKDTMVQGNLTNLTCATQYHYRVTAANTIGGMANGNDRTLSTSACPLPAVVTAPTTGAVWKLLSNNNVTWSWFTGTKVKIDLYKGGILNRAIAASAANNGIFIWNPPSTQTLGSNYFFKVTSITVPSQSAISGVFTVAPAPPPPMVVSPSDAGTIWKRKTSYNIIWKDFLGTQVRIYLYKGSSVNNTIANPAMNTGNLNWNVPSTQAVGTNYKIRVQSVSTGGYDESNNYFSIQ